MPAKRRPTAAKKSARKMPAFTKPSPATMTAFERAVDGLASVEHRTMFGYPSVFLNGNMLASIFQDRVMVRLSEPDRAEAMRRAGAKPFEPSPGRAMKEYMEFPAAVAGNARQLRDWIERGRAYVATLPTKPKKKSK
jgi:TfoX/Sxy family transcriptional regulator of competence genes